MLDVEANVGNQIRRKQSSSTSSADNEHQDRILWGIDPDQMRSAELDRMKRFLELWNCGQHKLIRPITIVQSPEVFGTFDITGPLRSNMQRIAYDNLKSGLKRLGMSDTLDPLVVAENTTTRSAAVRALIDFALEDKVQLIAVNTSVRADQGFWRGRGFTEKLIASSPVPVLSINPETVLPERISRILFATDFSRSSRRTFRLVIQWALQHQADLLLFHKDVPLDLPPRYSDFGFLIDARIQETMMRVMEGGCMRRMQAWSGHAEKKGLTVESLMSRHPDSTGDGILAAAGEKGADLIVVGTRHGPVGQKLLGSVAREILVSAKCPVVIVHEKN